MGSAVEAFINHVEADTRSHGIELRFVPSSIVSLPDDPAYECAGYFIAYPQKLLVVATNKSRDEWLSVLAHEYSHFRQWVDGASVWHENHVKGLDGEAWLDDWINRRVELDEHEVHSFMRSALHVELDAEVRALEYIRGFALPLCTEMYAKKANASLYYYSIIPKTRRWFDVNPFDIEPLYSKMPSDLMSRQEYVDIPEYYEQIYREHCFKDCTILLP